MPTHPLHEASLAWNFSRPRIPFVDLRAARTVGRTQARFAARTPWRERDGRNGMARRRPSSLSEPCRSSSAANSLLGRREKILCFDRCPVIANTPPWFRANPGGRSGQPPNLPVHAPDSYNYYVQRGESTRQGQVGHQPLKPPSPSRCRPQRAPRAGSRTRPPSQSWSRPPPGAARTPALAP